MGKECSTREQSKIKNNSF